MSFYRPGDVELERGGGVSVSTPACLTGIRMEMVWFGDPEVGIIWRDKQSGLRAG